MPQLFLPMFPEGVTPITGQLAVAKEDGRVTYFHGVLPVFSHDEKDIRTFRMITAQFCCSGVAKQADIMRAFGVTKQSVLRSVKLYREKGSAGFFAPRRSRGPAVLTPTVLAQAQAMLDGKADVPEVARQLGLKSNTLSKAVRAGRLHAPKKTN